MLSIKTEAVQQRPIIDPITGDPTLCNDNKLRLTVVRVDFRNERLVAYLEIGAKLATNVEGTTSAWFGSGRDLQVVFDTSTGRPNALHDNVWGYLLEQAGVDPLSDPFGTAINLALVEQIIVDRELLLDWVDTGGE